MRVTKEMIDAGMTAWKHEYAATRKSTELCITRALKALADRPPQMLTDEEVAAICLETKSYSTFDFVRAIELAHIKKQSAPETVPFDFTTWQKGGWVALSPDGIKQYHLYSGINYTSMVRES